MFEDDWTPAHLTGGPTNLYKEIAFALKGVEWRQPGLVAVASKLAASAAPHKPIRVVVPDTYEPKRGPNKWKDTSFTRRTEALLRAFDFNRDIVISAAEMHELLSSACPSLPRAESAQLHHDMLRVYDAKGDGQLSVEEVAAYCVAQDLDGKLVAEAAARGVQIEVSDARRLSSLAFAPVPAHDAPVRVDDVAMSGVAYVDAIPEPAEVANTSSVVTTFGTISDRLRRAASEMFVPPAPEQEPPAAPPPAEIHRSAPSGLRTQGGDTVQVVDDLTTAMIGQMVATVLDNYARANGGEIPALERIMASCADALAKMQVAGDFATREAEVRRIARSLILSLDA